MKKVLSSGAALSTALFLVIAPSLAQQTGVTESNGIAAFDPPASPTAIDFIAARVLALPTPEQWSDEVATRELAMALASGDIRLIPQVGRPTMKVGRDGTGKTVNVDLGEPQLTNEDSDSLSSVAFGTSNLPFTTARADISGLRINEELPLRPAGKLFFVDGGQSFICSGAMVDKGLVITAAHCVSEFGRKRFFSNWGFAPGYRNGSAPFDEWSAERVYIKSSYYDGTDNCDPSNPGVVCENDVAIIVLQPKTDAIGNTDYAGDRTGWYAVGWNQVGFTASGVAQLTQLGYPACLDHGAFMQRNDSLANISPEFGGNSVFGSLMCGGSSGGPVLINFGVEPELIGTTAGASPDRDVVVGVTSWGSTNTLVKRMGASPFRDTNVKALIEQACSDFSEACE